MTIDELITSIAPLSHADKIRLAQAVLQHLAHEEGTPEQPSTSLAKDFEPKRFYGAAHRSRQEVDHYLASAREDWN
ncbi:MAG: hypothetical protein ACFCBW_03575 [Candidatus Competibacterales bacterium]